MFYVYNNKSVIKMEKNIKEIIAKYLVENGYIEKDDTLIEYAKKLTEAITIHHQVHNNDKFLFTTKMPSVNAIRSQLQNRKKSQYYINFISGEIDDTTKRCVKKVSDCSFNVAIMDEDEKSLEDKKYKLVKYSQELFAKGLNVQLIYDDIEDKKIYLLTNRRKKENEK